MSAFAHVLVGVDLDEISEHALSAAIALARRLGARVTALHVYRLPIYRLADADYIPTAEEVSAIADAAQRGLDAMLDRHRAEGVELSSSLRSGRPAVEIVAASEELGADLVVVGTHGRGAVARALLGSVALEVLRHASVPVLSIRGGARHVLAA